MSVVFNMSDVQQKEFTGDKVFWKVQTDAGTTKGLGVPTPHAAENPYITFGSLKT